MTIFLCPSWIRCWIDLPEKGGYCFLVRYSGYNQISIAPEDEEKNTFTYPYGTLAFRIMSFGLCNNLSEMYDVNIFLHGGGHYRSFYG